MTSTNATKTGPGRPAIEGQRIEIKLEADLLDQVNAYAAEHDLRRPDALRALLRAGLGAGATVPARKTIRDLFPEADDAMSEDEFNDLISGESDGDGESVEYEYDGHEFCLHYTKVRGHWIFEVEEPTDETDHRGSRRYRHTYTVCADKREAKRRYREAIIEASAAWRPKDGVPMWADAWDVTFQQFEKDGGIPLGTFDTDAALDARDALEG